MTTLLNNSDLFHHRSFLLLNGVENGHEYAFLWLQILGLAEKINANGWIGISKEIPFTVRALSQILTFSDKEIAKGLEIFEKLGLIAQKNGFIQIRNWLELTLETTSTTVSQHALRQRRYRERLKKRKENERLRENTHCNNADPGNEKGSPVAPFPVSDCLHTSNINTKPTNAMDMDTVTNSVTRDVTDSVTDSVTNSVTSDVTQIAKNGINTGIYSARASVTDIVTDTVTNGVTNCVTGDVTDTVTDGVTDSVTRDVTQTVTDTVTSDVTRVVKSPKNGMNTGPASVTDGVTNSVTDSVTRDVTDGVTDSVTRDVTQTVTDTVTGDVTRVVKSPKNGMNTGPASVTDGVTNSVTDPVLYKNFKKGITTTIQGFSFFRSLESFSSSSSSSSSSSFSSFSSSSSSSPSSYSVSDESLVPVSYVEKTA
jgi:hypothetical protein